MARRHGHERGGESAAFKGTARLGRLTLCMNSLMRCGTFIVNVHPLPVLVLNAYYFASNNILLTEHFVTPTRTDGCQARRASSRSNL